jgi:MYXO-CTERM domain-containing protein
MFSERAFIWAIGRRTCKQIHRLDSDLCTAIALSTVISRSLSWLVVGVGLVVGACDQAVPNEGPVPHGEINNDTLQLPPVDTLGGTLGGPDVAPTDFVPPDCNQYGCPVSVDPCYSSVCNYSTGACMTVNNDGAACDDGNACTVNDTCKSGTCTAGSARQCPATDQCHDAGTCSAAAGGCTNPPKQNGTGCNDGNNCTLSDTCQNGVCTAGSTRQCTATDQCHMLGTCDPTSGSCSNPAKPNGSSCNDNMACTASDQCMGGICMGTVSCPAIDQCHDAGTCAAGGTCTTPAKANGTTCNDTSLCTTGDVCMGGVCKGTTMVTCTALDQCHDPGICNDNTGQCSNPIKPVGTTCTDGMLCTYGDACNANGACMGTMVTCTSDESTIRECDGTATCKVTPRPGAACDDGNPCTKGDARNAAGTCVGTPYTCDVGPCTTANTCDGMGGCVPTAKADGTMCDADGSKCTPHDRCQGGVCVRDPSPVTCVKRDCNTVSCNPTTGNCDYVPTTGDACGVTGCFTAGTCNNGVCSGTPRDCSSFNGPCTTGICDARTGGCAAEYKSNGTSCDPGGQCVAGAVCAFGICELPPSSCPAPSGPCKVAACMPSNGACYEMDLASGTACDPKASCMGAGLCDDQGRCLGTPAPNGSSCTLPGGAVGLCVTGSCITTDAPDAGGNDAGRPDAGRDPKSPGGCGCGVVSSTGSGGTLAALVLAALAFAGSLARRRRTVTARRQSESETRRPTAR